MQQSCISKKQRQIEWRRNQVLSLSGDGYSEREIAKRLEIINNGRKVSDTTVHKDLVYLRETVKDRISRYMDDRVPFEYEKTLAGLQTIIKSMAGIIETSTENREIMQASTVKMQAYAMKMELVSGANLVIDTNALMAKSQLLEEEHEKKNSVVTTDDNNQLTSQVT